MQRQMHLRFVDAKTNASTICRCRDSPSAICGSKNECSGRCRGRCRGRSGIGGCRGHKHLCLLVLFLNVVFWFLLLFLLLLVVVWGALVAVIVVAVMVMRLIALCALACNRAFALQMGTHTQLINRIACSAVISKMHFSKKKCIDKKPCLENPCLQNAQMSDYIFIHI